MFCDDPIINQTLRTEQLQQQFLTSVHWQMFEASFVLVAWEQLKGFCFYQSNLLHPFALLDLFSAFFPSPDGICIPITALSVECKMMNDMFFSLS